MHTERAPVNIETLAAQKCLTETDITVDGVKGVPRSAAP